MASAYDPYTCPGQVDLWRWGWVQVMPETLSLELSPGRSLTPQRRPDAEQRSDKGTLGAWQWGCLSPTPVPCPLIRSAVLMAITMAKGRMGRNVSEVQESLSIQCVLWLRSSPGEPRPSCSLCPGQDPSLSPPLYPSLCAACRPAPPPPLTPT